MSQLKSSTILPLAVALLEAAGYAYYRAQARQTATLARITALETCLAASNHQRARAARSTVSGISEAVRKNRNQANDVSVLRQAQEIQGRTKAVIDTLHQLRQSWYLADHRPELRQLPAQLDHYILFSKRFLPDVPTQLASAGWLADFDAVAAQKPAALALLTRLENQVRQIESEALQRQAQKVGSGCGFDKMGAVVLPASETVAPGAVYQAQLIIALATSSGSRRFSANGREVPMNPATGQGLVQFKIPAARPDQPDTVRATWHGRVQMPWADADTVLETTVPYFIVKPLPR